MCIERTNLDFNRGQKLSQHFKVVACRMMYTILQIWNEPAECRTCMESKLNPDGGAVLL